MIKNVTINVKCLEFKKKIITIIYIRIVRKELL
jgi:hypothetical protein